MKTSIYYMLAFTAVLFFTGCSESSDENQKARKAFIAEHGASSVYVCNESGFLENHYFDALVWEEKHRLVVNDAGIPIRCDVKDISIQVKETVATGALSGSAN